MRHLEVTTKHLVIARSTIIADQLKIHHSKFSKHLQMAWIKDCISHPDLESLALDSAQGFEITAPFSQDSSGVWSEMNSCTYLILEGRLPNNLFMEKLASTILGERKCLHLKYINLNLVADAV